MNNIEIHTDRILFGLGLLLAAPVFITVAPILLVCYLVGWAGSVIVDRCLENERRVP